MDFAHLDAGQYKHSALGLLDFHPIPWFSFCSALCPFRHCLYHYFSPSSSLSSQRTAPWHTHSAPSSIWSATARPPQQLIQKQLQPFRTQQHQHQKPGQHPEPQNGSAIRTRPNKATPDQTAPCVCARSIAKVEDPNPTSNGQFATTNSTLAAWPISSHTTTGLHAPLAATHGKPHAKTSSTSNASRKGTFGRGHPTHCLAGQARPQPRSQQHHHHPNIPWSYAAPACCWSTQPTQQWMKHGENSPTWGT